ncbi:MAG: 30S ribosomal protein S5 [Nanoarchaeota archaeon]|nr:30S ribosomal protein S5 [Nanoarchaeota archaeon]|tara:strand:+ start:9753 stop:10505 length:753 start_codon:yes stop_codon:yes gene_type:complete
MAREKRRQKSNQRPREPVVEKIWKPKTELGKKVQQGEIADIDQVFDSGENIIEAEITEALLPDLEQDLLLIGQAKGKFGGGQRRIFRQTQKKTREGNKIYFQTCALVGNKNGFVGMAIGKSKETVPARDKSVRKAKLKLLKIRRGCGSWECGCKDPHSIPFAVEGKSGSCIVKLIPAPKGKGLCIEKESAKVLHMAGIKDVWSKTVGQTKTKVNLLRALEKALIKLGEVRVSETARQTLGMQEGKLKNDE